MSAEEPVVTLDTLKLLGVDPEDLQERMIERIADRLLNESYYDDDEREMVKRSSPTGFMKKLRGMIEAHVDKQIRAVADQHILPNVSTFIEDLKLQETTKWGEKKGEPVSFLEYLVARADAYMKEPVDHNGKAKGEGGSDSYNWRGTQTRLTSMVHAHLAHNIAFAMETALKQANQSIAGGIVEAAKIKMNEIAASLKVTTSVKS